MIRFITTLIITLSVFVSTVFSQETSTLPNSNLTGDWYGQLDIQGTKLKINFHVLEKEGIYITTMDSPDQGAMGLPTTKTIVNNNILEVILEEMKVHFIGELKDDKIEGIFKQNDMEMPLVLTRTKIILKKPKARSQDPKKPYNYKSEEVFFTNKKANNIKLAGTLTLPKEVKNPPVAILITGSGPQNRNSEIFNHRPFLVISNYLTNNGIAVLRYDDRGVAESEGTQKEATSADFATDVEAAVAYLKTRKDINIKKIGLIGHSEGGFIAPMVAAKDKTIAFIVSLAGTGVNGSKVLLAQTRKANELAGTTKDVLDFNEKHIKSIHDVIITSKEVDNLEEKITTHLNNFKKNDASLYASMLTEQQIKQQATAFSSKWIAYFIKTDPKQFLEQVTCPVLALNGSKDFQVLPKLNLNGIKSALKNNKDVTIIELDGLNHFFQTCKTGALDEYAKIEETFNEKALKIIADWINKRF